MYNSYDYGTDAAFGALGAVAGGLFAFLMVMCIIVFAISVFEIVCYWRVFKKAGKNGWEAIIPFYNGWVLFEISGYPGWLILLALTSIIPFVGWIGVIALFVFQILAGISLAKKFGKTDAFGVLLALVPVVGYAILAFSEVTYDASLGNQPGEKATSNSNNVFCSNCGKSVPSDTKFCPSCGKEI